MGGGGQQPAAHRVTQKRREHRKNRGAKEPRPGQTQPGGGQAKQKDKAAKGKGEAHQNAPGRPARPTRPSNMSRRPDGRVRARRVPRPYRLRTAAVRMDECAPGGYPTPTRYEQPRSGWMSARPGGGQPLPAKNSRGPDGRVSAPQRRPRHATWHAQLTAQHTERAHG